MEHKRIQFDFEVKELSDSGTFEGYGAVFGNVDAGGDVIKRGAFKRTLAEHKKKGRLPAMLWQHDPRVPIGKYDLMKEDDRGLYVKGVLALKTERGHDAFELMKLGAIDGLSIGYMPKVWEFDEEEAITTLKEVDLWEVSLVTFPMNDEARVSDVKNLFAAGQVPTVREAEEFLRESGFSQAQALAMAAAFGKCVPKSQRDSEIVGVLKQLTEEIRNA